MAAEILIQTQKKFLSLLSREKQLTRQFYLGGGTALAAFYLHHRLSEDLDFFSTKEVDIMEINVFLKSIKSVLGIRKIDFQRTFNRNLFFLHIGKEILKTEFTYFPFTPIEKPANINGINVDSITDIAVNKVFTIYQSPRSRDFIDLYFILDKYRKISFAKLMLMARSKFDTAIDPLQMGAQLTKAKTIIDLPIMLAPIEHTTWRQFFIRQAQSLSSKIFK